MGKISRKQFFFAGFCFEGVLFLALNFTNCLNRCKTFNSTAFVILLVQALIIGFLAWGIRKMVSQKARDFIFIGENESIRPAVSVTLFVLAVVIWTVFLLFSKQLYLVYFQGDELNRMVLNFLLFLAVLVLELFICLPIFFANKGFIFNLKQITNDFAFFKNPGKTTVFTFILIAVTALIVTITGAGLNPDNITIIDLGVPLLESQIIFGAGLIILMIWMDFGYGANWFFGLKQDTIEIKKWGPVIFIALWAFTFITWNAQEIPIYNNFVIGNIPPNYEFFPYSDAKYYDKNAIMMMLGDGRGRCLPEFCMCFSYR